MREIEGELNNGKN